MFPSKILLFGEYSVMFGSQALAFPYAPFHGQFVFTDKQTAITDESNQSIRRVLCFLQSIENELLASFDLKKLEKELDAGLYFASNIPQGYGLGSSGALVAALFDRYKTTEASFDYHQLKRIFAQLESFFHGSSSGFDPLVAYTQQAILQSDDEIKQTNVPLGRFEAGSSFFLIDTKLARQTAPLVELFVTKSKNANFLNQLKQNYIPQVNAAIAYTLSADSQGLQQRMQDISRFQYSQMREFIPDTFHSIWNDGLENKQFALKLCGAGGGGFILGFSTQYEKLHHWFSSKQLAVIPLE